MSDGLIVVGIGSSAGGLEALQEIFSNLPDIKNCAFVVVQHLSPTHRSMMTELLTRVSNIPVIEVKSGMKIKAKTIYMTPEDTDIYVKSGKLYLNKVEQAFGPRPSINYFFSSLASDFQNRAIGIILSGTGSDGSYGIRAIKAEGGITIAQAPKTAKYDGMPLAAIYTGKVDLVVPIENISTEIDHIIENVDKNLNLSLNDKSIEKIYRILFEEKEIDFSLYKKSTIIRRIERRLATLKMDNIAIYVEYLEKNQDEVSSLYNDILIGVTSFFRDKELFADLQKYIEEIVSKKEQGEEIRFWSIGCSTGEEAYSIAIMLSEVLGEKVSKYKIKIFATDIDDESLRLARLGVYAEESMREMDKALISKYFSVQKNQYEIKKNIRELVIFSKHNIIADSPFLRLDLVSCRNLLIYFNQTLQSKFFQIVHYALNNAGFLFLGKSESIGQHIDLFEIISRGSKIYKANYTGIKETPKLLFKYSSAYKNYVEPAISRSKSEEETLEDVVTESVQELLFNKCAIVNSANDVIYIRGKIPYIVHAEGKITNNIFKLVKEELSLDLRTAINEATKDRKLHPTPFKLVNIYDGILRYVRVIVVPVQNSKSEEWFNVLYFQSEESQVIKSNIITDGDNIDVVERLTLELDSTKSHLQNVIEELETSYEEMQSLNEELQSSNEELQSSNEELETTNEELQSTNEELQTAYTELKLLYNDKEKRTDQLEKLTDKINKKSQNLQRQQELLEDILDTVPIAIIMANEDGRIKFVNKFLESLYGIDKKGILGKMLDGKEWNIKVLDRDSSSSDDLPFGRIKKSFESIYDYECSIDVDEQILYLSISGSPLFDIDGRFQGAIFCLDNLGNLSNFHDISNISSKENTILKDYNLSNILHLDLISMLRNELNDILLQSKLLESKDDTDVKDIGETIIAKIDKLSNTLDEKYDTYSEKIKLQEEYFLSELKDTIKSYQNIFDYNDIAIHYDINSQRDIKLYSNKNRRIISLLLEFCLNVKIHILNEYKLAITIKNSAVKDKLKIVILFTCKGVRKQEEKLKKSFKILENELSSIDIKSTLVISNTMQIGIEIDE